ncbi:MAG TPA: PfkB family carbohydrate kinase, partial [Mucilaginibacter sp.]
GKIFSAPALPLEEVFDPTGAGDTFAGGFIGYMAKVGEVNFTNMKNAIIYGSALASFCVETFGTEKLKKLTEAVIADRIQQFVSLSKFEIA